MTSSPALANAAPAQLLPTRAKPFNPDLRDRLAAHAAAHGLTNTQLARELATSPTAVSKYINGKPEGDVTKLESIIEDVLKSSVRRAALGVEIFETSVTQQIGNMVETVRRVNGCGLITAPAGTGKTCAVALYAAQTPSANRIAKLRAATAEITAPLEARQKDALRQAEKFAESHRGELFPGTAKTGESPLTKFGFRLGNPTLATLNRKHTWPSILDKLKSCGFARFVLTREEPDKEAMKTQMTEAELAQVGARITQSERFFVEPKREPTEQQLTGERQEVAV